MGLAYILQEAKTAGWEPHLYDSCAEGFSQYREDAAEGIRITGLPSESALERIRAVKPDLIGVSLGLSTDHDQIRDLVARIKETYDIPVLLGGSEASLMHREILTGLPVEQIPADIVVTGRDIGSGEESIRGILEAAEGKRQLHDVRGIAYKEQERLVVTPPTVASDESLAKLLLPARNLFARIGSEDIYSHINQSHTGPANETPYAVMHTSRGCGGSCTFCHTQYGGFDRAVIRRSLENIFAELDDLKARGVRTISIEDDNFGGFTPTQTGLAVKILEAIEERGFSDIYFPNGMTIRSMLNNDYAIPKQLRKMADNGMSVRNSLPIECGEQETLSKIIRKPHSIDDVKRLLGELRNGYLQGIEWDAFFMVGVVGYDARSQEYLREPTTSVRKTFDLADQVSDLGIRINIWWMKPNPNGPQYKLWREKNPEMPFYKLQFSFTPGIWGTPEQEASLDEQIRRKNEEMNQRGVGSKRPIYPTNTETP